MSSPESAIRDRIRTVMPSVRFHHPATHSMIDAAQQSLGVEIPNWLRNIYLACNGFIGPTDVRYLYPLDGSEGAAQFTSFLRTEWTTPWLHRALVFSDNGMGGSLTVHWAILDGQLIEWCYGNGDAYTVADGDFFELLSREQALWDDADNEFQ